MADNALPFELIARFDPTTHRPEDHKKLLERRQLPRFLSDNKPLCRIGPPTTYSSPSTWPCTPAVRSC
jgi:hypothetical protein